MAPTININSEFQSEQKIYARQDVILDHDDDIVISGMSGRFPNSHNVAEFEHNLYNKIDMVCDSARWPCYSIEIPKRYGLLPDVDKFDATFFGINNKQANTFDPQYRILHEVVFEAILDAGINPKSLRGTNTGIYIGCCFSEAQAKLMYKSEVPNGFAALGCLRSSCTSRLSCLLGTNGPAQSVDTACSSSQYALDLAFTAIKNGTIDAAIVAGSNLILHPNITLQFVRLGVIALDGHCRPLDEQASGYTRSEGVPAIILQRRKDAKRIYAVVMYSKTNCDGHKPEGITFPSGRVQELLLKDVYRESGIDPNALGYLEAHSTGTIAGDPQECLAITNALVERRTEPLLLGSVKSCMGHSEAASALCSLVKVLLTFECGKIPPNLNFSNIRNDIPSLADGRLKVVDEVTDLKKPLIAINSFGFGGANGHAVFRQHSKEKLDRGRNRDRFPRLFTWSARTRSGVEKLWKKIESWALDIEYLGLLQGIRTETIQGFFYRSFGLFSESSECTVKCISKAANYFNGEKHCNVWIFPGFEHVSPISWSELINIPTFCYTMAKCDTILRSNGVNFIRCIVDEDQSYRENSMLNKILRNVAIQIALIDLARELKWQPDFMIGQGLGEIACAYADGCLTTEQAILTAYTIGLIISESKNDCNETMARVNFSVKYLEELLPETLEVVENSSLNSCVIAGDKDDLCSFVDFLNVQGENRAELLEDNGILWASKRMLKKIDSILEILTEIIPFPKIRSSKWISTSIRKELWDRPEAQYASAEYFLNSLSSRIHLSDAMCGLKKHCIATTMGATKGLKADIENILPNSLHFELIHGNDLLNGLLTSFGRLYLHGVDIQPDHLYQRVEYPVSRGTPSISSYLDWNYDSRYYILALKEDLKKTTERNYKITLDDDPFLRGHCIDGRILIPATFYIIRVWEIFMPMRTGEHADNTSVEFEDIRFLRATHLAERDIVELNVSIHRGTGFFEITDRGTPVVQGIVREVAASKPTTPDSDAGADFPILDARDFYKELRLRGYHYRDAFRGVEEARSDGRYGKIKWDMNWVTFLDCVMQMSILRKDSRGLMLPTRIEKLRINGELHLEMGHKWKSKSKYFEVFGDATGNRLVSGGVEIIGMKATGVERRKPPGMPILERYTFVPHFPSPRLKRIDAVRVCVQLATEISGTKFIKVVEIDSLKRKPIVQMFRSATEDLPLLSIDVEYLSARKLDIEGVRVEKKNVEKIENCTYLICSDVLEDKEFLLKLSASLELNGMLLCREGLNTVRNIPNGFENVAQLLCQEDDEVLVLLRKIAPDVIESTKVVKVCQKDTSYSWINEIQSSIGNFNRILVVSQGEHFNGILGFVNCLRKEPLGKISLICVFIDDNTAPEFHFDAPFYKNQLKLGLPLNVYRKGKWGTYRHLLLETEIQNAPQNCCVYASLSQRGDLSSWVWIRGAKPSNSTTIVYSALNFRDVMIASNRLPIEFFNISRLNQRSLIGLEFSGVTENGRRVMGMIPSGALASHVNLDDAITIDITDNWSLEEAATVPVVYLTVYYAFFLITDVRRGGSILIHSGTGGIGLSAIRVALAYGLEVFTTVGSSEKAEFLMKTFPELKRSHIGNSRNTSFEDMVKLETNGLGVDFVLNSLSEDKLLASVRCLAQRGHFLEIGKFDIANDSKLGLSTFEKGISFSAVFADELFDKSRIHAKTVIDLVKRDIKSGIVKPLPSTIFPANEVEQAFRYLSAGKHIGKVLVKVRENLTAEFTYPLKSKSQVEFYPNFVYVIPGGLGGFGLELVDWMIIRGARKIVLSSSRGLTKGYQAYRIDIWKSYGAKILVRTDDITTYQGCENLIMAANNLGPIGGIFNLAVCLRDGIFINQNIEMFNECMAPKAKATLYLDNITRRMCPEIQHFVVFSSVSCGRGNAGQTNYGMANSVMERVVEARVADGFSGKAIQWGAVGEVGIVADMAEDKIDMEIGGTLQQRISSCLGELDKLLASPDAIVSSMVVAEAKVGRSGKKDLFGTVMDIIGIRDLKAFSMQATLSEAGLDSLMTVEVKQTLEREFEVNLSPDEVRNLTFQSLQEISDRKEAESADTNVLTTSKIDAAAKSPTKNPTHKIIALDLCLENLGYEKFSNEMLLKIQGITSADAEKSGVNRKLIIPGVECVAGCQWHEICAKSFGDSYILQLLNNESTSIDGLIAHCIENVKNVVFKNQSEYQIIGYSYGTVLAIRLAELLEKSGMRGKLLLIDGSPKFVYTLMLSRIPDFQQFSLLDATSEFPKWNEILTDFLQNANQKSNFSNEFCSKLVKSVYNRSKSIADISLITETESNRIESLIKLIRPTEASITDIEADYDLNRHTNSKVDLTFLDGNHTTILDNPRLIDLINQWFS